MPGDSAHGEPAPFVGGDGHPGTVRYTLTVDGEVFEIRARDGGTDYGWVSGPNKDYGFSSSESSDVPEEAHRQSIRSFLGMIDPATSFIADD